MRTRSLVIIVVIVVAVVLTLVLTLTDDDGDPVATSSPTPTATLEPSTSPPATAGSPTPSATPSPTPSASAAPAGSFTASGDLVSGWYWLRDAAHVDAATWGFSTLPTSGDLVFTIEVLATDAVDGVRDQDARFFFAWGPPGGGEWLGRLPVTLPNVSPLDDPVGYTCRGTVTVPRSTAGDAGGLTVRIGRDDVRGELPPIDEHVGVNATSVKLRVP